VDAIRIGLSVRALRRRLRWTQAALGERVGASASAISRIERGRAADVTVGRLERVATALGARLVVTVLWQGEAVDRLLGAGHARLVDWTIDWLGRIGWNVVPEVTFQIRGERGSIDVLARHRSGALLIVEVKSVVPDIQAMLASLDRKTRLARAIASERGWSEVTTVSRLLVLPADRTARRRIGALDAIFRTALPARSIAIRRWAREPSGSIAGVLFVPDVREVGARHRVTGPRGPNRAEARSPMPGDRAVFPPGENLSAAR